MSSTKTARQLANLIDRVIDRSAPNLPPPTGEARWESRSNRTFPLLLAPWENGGPVATDVVHGLTKNLAYRGMAVVLTQPFHAEAIVAGFWFERQPHYVLGAVRQNTNLGGGFWQLGVELTKLVTPADYPSVARLTPFVARLAVDWQ